MDHRLPAETIALLDIHRAFGIKWIFPIGMTTHFLTLWNALLIALWKSPFKIPSSPLLKGHQNHSGRLGPRSRDHLWADGVVLSGKRQSISNSKSLMNLAAVGPTLPQISE